MTGEISAEALDLEFGSDRLSDSNTTCCVCRAAPSASSFLFYFLGQNRNAAVYRHLSKQCAVQYTFIRRLLQGFVSTLLLGTASFQSVAPELAKFI